VFFEEHPSSKTDVYLVYFLEHVLEHRSFFTVIFQEKGVPYFRKRFQSYLIEHAMQRLIYLSERYTPSTPIPLELIAYFYSGAIVSSLDWWVKEDFKQPPQEMASYIIQLTSLGKFALFHKPEEG
jgi:hypothetical protein